MDIQSLVHTLAGHCGQYLRGKWEPDEVLHRLLLAANICVSRTVAVQIINGHKSISAEYIKCYRKEHGITLLTNELIAFVQGYHSAAMLRDIQLQIHMAVAASDWSVEQLAVLEEYYVAGNASREQVAVYIAHVMHAAITCIDSIVVSG